MSDVKITTHDPAKQPLADQLEGFLNSTTSGQQIVAAAEQRARRLLREEIESIVGGAFRAMWQPIETAPKDGTSILGYYPPAGNTRYVFADIRWQLCSDKLHGYWVPINGGGQPTHWMPLPEPPK